MTVLSTAIDQFVAQGYTYIDDFLPSSIYQALNQHFQDTLNAQRFRSSTVGQQALSAPHIRNDQLHWLTRSDPIPAVQAYFEYMMELCQTLNQSLFLGLQTLEAHYSFYPPGHFYKKHVDQFSSSPSTRRLSCVYYLNKNWQPQDQGELLLYQENSKHAEPLAPIGNRLVFFQSHLLHEVALTHAPRYSIAAWFHVRSLT